MYICLITVNQFKKYDKCTFMNINVCPKKSFSVHAYHKRYFKHTT